MSSVTNIVVAGLGGQGVLKGTDILAEVALKAGYDVKKSEIKGMSQRGGSVTGDVRFGTKVFSPMVPSGTADYLLVLEQTQVEPNRHYLAPGAVVITPQDIDTGALPSRKTLNIALLGCLSSHLPFTEEVWIQTLKEAFDQVFFRDNEKAFLAGRAAAAKVGFAPTQS